MTAKTATAKTVLDVQAEVEARRKRAAEALASGKYRVQKIEKGRWAVINGDGVEYTVAVQDGRPTCTCPDFKARGETITTCKHIEMVKLVVRQSQNGTASARASSQASAPAPAKPTPAPEKASRPAPAPAAPSNGSTVEPEQVVVHWGRYSGKRLEEIAREAPGFLAWLAFKMEARSEQDRALQQAARAVYDRTKATKAARKGGRKASIDAFIVAAGVELLKQVWEAQSKGRDIALIEKALELRLQAIRLVADRLRQLIE